MTNPNIFISYSHKDEDWKDRVVTHLRVLEMEGMLDVWDDRRIEGGDDWFPEIEEAINNASIAIFLVSANFLTSKFIRDEEVSRLLTRREEEGVRIIPVIVKPCAWTQVKWLSPIQARPKDGRALSAGNENQIDTDITALVNEIAGFLKRIDVKGESRKTTNLPPEKISLAKLPSTSTDLFGREKELKELDDAWNNSHVNAITLIAWGGVGKSSLVNKWLSQMAKDNYRGAERVFGWSFYSQGAAEGRQVSADEFISSALTWFGDPDPNLGSPWDKGERLAELVKASRVLLILDGLEPLQTPPPVETGHIKDPALGALLRELGRQNPGMLVISTRLAVDDLKGYIGDTVIERDLDNLSPEAGAIYLSHLGVTGSKIELQNAVRDFSGHALALTLLGRYLVDVYDGDARKRDLIAHVTNEEEKGGHAKRIMQAYEKWFEGQAERDLLTIMGLFDRPIEKGALDALLVGPAINGLTSKIHGISEEKYKLVLKHLRKARLLIEPSEFEADTLDCHPLLREYFGEQLKRVDLHAWREGNSRVYEYYKSSAKDFPMTLREMAPLFAAVRHGCQAGLYKGALDLFIGRIVRRQSFLIDRLGAISSSLSILSNFFELPWNTLVSGLQESEQGYILNDTGFCLFALGRTTEALEPTKLAFDKTISIDNLTNATRSAINLSKNYMLVGELDKALSWARRSVEVADSSNDLNHSRGARAHLGVTLHQMGYFAEAENAFFDALAVQRRKNPGATLFISSEEFEYHDFLLSQHKYKKVEQRAGKILKLLNEESSLLDIACNNLSLGRAHMGQIRYNPNYHTRRSLIFLNQGVDGFRQAGYQDELICGLLARTEFYRTTNTLDKAQNDLDEAFSIATRCGMELYLANCQLEYARLKVEKSKELKNEILQGSDGRRNYLDEARKHFNIAKEMIEKMGYHRRDKEVEELKYMLDNMSI